MLKCYKAPPKCSVFRTDTHPSDCLDSYWVYCLDSYWVLESLQRPR